MTIAHLVTHSGGFHADELLSSVVLTRLFPQARITRTRDAAWTTPALLQNSPFEVSSPYPAIVMPRVRSRRCRVR
jgi:hypothetical protein